jgi:hypothetical protein
MVKKHDIMSTFYMKPMRRKDASDLSLGHFFPDASEWSRSVRTKVWETREKKPNRTDKYGWYAATLLWRDEHPDPGLVRARSPVDAPSRAITDEVWWTGSTHPCK